MAASLTDSSRRSVASSAASLKRSGDSARSHKPPSSHSHSSSSSSDAAAAVASIPVDTLVNHLLAAKRSLSSMNLVLRGHELATHARASHEGASVLAAQAGFLRSAVLDQAAILVRLRRTLQGTYDWGKRDFKTLVRAMDEADGALEGTMEMLRATVVQSVLRPKGEADKTLLDFVDEESVHGMRDAMKKSIEELQGIQQSFDGDLLRFDTDIRNLKKIISDAAPPLPTDDDDDENDDDANIHMTERLDILGEHSSNMAQLLASLTKHFDMCVTAVRTTEGAAALARRKAAESTQSQGPDGVSISGVIAEQESNVSDLEPKTAKDRAEMLKVVVQDAGEVDDVVQEIHDRLTAMEHESGALERQSERTRAAYASMLEACAALGDVGDRLADYMAAEDDFKQRWDLERDAVLNKLREMTDLREIYERYAGAYDSLILEVERRRAVDDKIAGVWRKAQDSVDKMLEADQASREAFRHDVGEFLPTDLWEGMQGPARRWKMVAVEGDDEAPGRSVVEAATRKAMTAREEGAGGEQTPTTTGAR